MRGGLNENLDRFVIHADIPPVSLESFRWQSLRGKEGRLAGGRAHSPQDAFVGQNGSGAVVGHRASQSRIADGVRENRKSRLGKIAVARDVIGVRAGIDDVPDW